MADEEKPKGKLTLGLGGSRPGFNRSGPNTVTVEVRKKRVINKPGEKVATEQQKLRNRADEIENDSFLTGEEKRARLNALQYAIKRARDEEDAKVARAAQAQAAKAEEVEEAEEEPEIAVDQAPKEIPTVNMRGGKVVERPRPQQRAQNKRLADDDAITAGSEPIKYSITKKEAPKVETPVAAAKTGEAKKPAVFRPAIGGQLTLAKKAGERDDDKGKKKSTLAPTTGGRRTSKITVTNFDQEDRHRSLASVKRQRDKHKRHDDGPKEKKWCARLRFRKW